MNIAELFVSVGLKGAEKVTSGFSQINKSLKDTVSTSIEAKAALIGVVYGLERITSSMGNRAIGWKEFNAITGINLQEIQKWEYAASKYSLGADQIRGSILGVNKAMAQMQITGEAPGAMGVLAANTPGGIDVKRAYSDTIYLYEKIQQFAKNAKMAPAIKSAFLDKFGLDDRVKAFLMTMNQKDLNIPRGYRFSDPQIDQGYAMGKQWNQFKYRLGVDAEKMSLTFGPAAIRDFNAALSQAEKILYAIEKKLGPSGTLTVAFLGLGAAVAAAFGPIGVASAGLIAMMAALDKHPEWGKEVQAVGTKVGDKFLPEPFKILAAALSAFMKPEGHDIISNQAQKLVPNMPKVQPTPAPNASVTVHQHGIDYRDADSNAKALHKELRSTQVQLKKNTPQ